MSLVDRHNYIDHTWIATEKRRLGGLPRREERWKTNALRVITISLIVAIALLFLR